MKNGRARYDIGWDNPKTTNLVWSCRENGPNTTTKNYDSLQTWRKKKTRPSPKNLERWNINSHEWKRSKNGRMEQPKAMELAVGRRCQTFLNRAIYIYIYIYIYYIYHLNWKTINQITFYFVEEGAGRGSEDIKKESSFNCFDFFFFSIFLMDVVGGKITINLKELH